MAAVTGHGHPWMPFRGAILLTVTSQGQKNSLQESRPLAIHWTVETLYMYSF